MKPRVDKSEIPSESALYIQLSGAQYFDCYQLFTANHHHSALDAYLAIVARTPAWFNLLMNLRNRVVSLFGLKNLGQIDSVELNKPSSEYQVGDRVGIFSLLSHSQQEVVLGDEDKHLGVRLSLYISDEKGKQKIIVSTVVHVHNVLGRIYMAFVAPLHRRIVPIMLARLGR